MVHRDLARVQQGNPPVPAWPLAFVVGEVVCQDVLREHFGEGARSPYGRRRPVPRRAEVGESPVDQPVPRRDVPEPLPDLVIVGISAIPDRKLAGWKSFQAGVMNVSTSVRRRWV